MRRRTFLRAIGAAAVWPVVARAQQAMPVVGFLNVASGDRSAARVALFRNGLSDVGFVEGRNVTIEYRWAEGRYERLAELATDLVRRRVTVIAATSAAAARAVKAVTSSIPIVFHIGADPVAIGLVSSLNRPGGNITGMYNLSAELEPKKLELLHSLVPSAVSFGHLVNPNTTAGEQRIKDIAVASSRLGLQIQSLRASGQSDLDVAFETLKQLRAGGMLIAGDLFFANQSVRLAALAARHRIPTVAEYRQFAAAGGLASYGAQFNAAYRQFGVYVGRVLKGENPADLPVQQSTNVGLVINLKTAQELGIKVPLAVLGRADEVIE